MIMVTVTVSPALKEMGRFGEMDAIENPGLDTVIEVICSVKADVLYRLRVSVNWFPLSTVAAVTSVLGEGPSQPFVAPPG